MKLLYTTLDLNNQQFMKVRTNGRSIFFIIAERHLNGQRKRSLKRETRIDIFERMLEDPTWGKDVLAATISNAIADARRRFAALDE
jgi:hypothetical protein